MRRPALAVLLLVLGLPALAAAQVDARMFRYADVSATDIAFVYAGDVWVVGKEGGVAHRLSSPAGEESFPRFSPEGDRIAFTGHYEGMSDVFVVPTMGGAPERTTHHSMDDRLVGWHPDGRRLLMASSRASASQRFNQLYLVAAEGGLPERLPVPYGEFGAISPDGTRLAYTPKARDFRTWKRYRGGWAPDIWLFDLETGESTDLTADSDANDGHPMWHGETLYFLSDRGPEMRFNIWAHELDTGSARQVTEFTDFDVTFPSIGPTEIVFQAGGRLHLLDLGTEEAREVPVQVVTDQAALRPRTVEVEDRIQGAWISPSGARAVFAARGQLFSVPAEHGPVLDLTRASGEAHRYPTWSPDGSQLAYWSDRSGEYELWIRPARENGEERRVTDLGPGFRYLPHWSPDGRSITFVDQTMTIRIVDVETGDVTDVDSALYWFHGQLQGFRPSWSPDGRWLAYSRDLEHRHSAIFLYDVENGERHQVTAGYYNDSRPAFDPDGKYLYFFSDRAFEPVYSDLDNTWVYPNATNIVAVPLGADTPSPLAPRNDREGTEESEDEGEEAEDEGEEAQDEGEEAEEAPSTEIVIEGFESRIVVLPPEPGNYSDLQAASGKLFYRRRPRSGSGAEESPIVAYDLEEREEQTVLEDADHFLLSANGEKLLTANEERWYIVDAEPDQETGDPLRTSEMETVVDPRAEWRQLFADAWRFQRDFFYDPDMHGVDWPAMREHYGRLLEDAVTRWDVNFVLGELIGELGASHTYRGGGDLEQPDRRNVGFLGVDWELADGAYRIARIVDGAPWDSETRSPLRRPGVDADVGDYVLAVNGVPLDVAHDPYRAFQGLGERTVELTLNREPTLEGARRVVVETLSSESRLRHLEWIEANRRRVDEATDGRVGYVYVPSTGVDGQTELVRQFRAQFTKEALIIDERWNSGGQIPDRSVELLDRRPLAYWAVRDGMDWQWPPVAHFGPKVMLINGWSGSGGDAFPAYFREAGLGPLIGERTWGGLIGLTGTPPLIDGGGVTAPTFRMYDPRGEWFPEGIGVQPDIPVVDDPTELARGRDPQLERAIEEVLSLLEERPHVMPDRPMTPVRTVTDRDRDSSFR